MTDEARTALMIALWFVSLALAFTSGWVWRNGRLAEEGEPGVDRPFGIDRGEGFVPPLMRLDAFPPEESWRPKRQRTTIPVRGSEWRSTADIEREGAAGILWIPAELSFPDGAFDELGFEVRTMDPVEPAPS